MKPRADGLYARLYEADKTGKLRESVFIDAFSGRSLADIVEELNRGGVPGGATESSLSKMLRTYGAQYKMEEAYKAASKLDNFDAGKAAAARRKGLAAQLAAAAYRDLSVKELVALKGIDLDEQEAEARRMEAEAALLSAQDQAAAWIVETLREVDKRSALSEIAGGEGTLAERIARVREIVFGAEVVKGGAA